jgi:hypothetical protein
MILAILNKKHKGILESAISAMVVSENLKFDSLFEVVGQELKPARSTRTIERFKKGARGIMCMRRLKVVAQRASLNKQHREKALMVFNDWTVVTYNEKIKTIPVTILNMLQNQDEFFSKYMKNEGIAVCLIRILQGVIDTTVTLSKDNMYEKLGLPVRTPTYVWEALLSQTDFVKSLYENFLIKINFGIENKNLFESAWLCGQIVIKILKNMTMLAPRALERMNIIKSIKKSTSLVCMYINKSQRMYKFRDKDDTVKLTGGSTVKPMWELRVMLCELLFSIIESDADANYESLGKIHDSTYHLLFVFAMERCHNTIYLSKFLKFLKILFQHGTEFVILNAIIKVNVIADLARFFLDYVNSDKIKIKQSETYIFFFKDLQLLVTAAGNRPGFKSLKSQLATSLNWKMFRILLRGGVKDINSVLNDDKIYNWNQYRTITSNVAMGYISQKAMEISSVTRADFMGNFYLGIN